MIFEIQDANEYLLEDILTIAISYEAINFDNLNKILEDFRQNKKPLTGHALDDFIRPPREHVKQHKFIASKVIKIAASRESRNSFMRKL